MTEREFQDILRDTRENMLDVMRQEGFYWGPRHDRKLRYDATVWDLNNGACDEFADAVAEAVPEAEALSDDQFAKVPEEAFPTHVFVHWRGKFYDSECIKGVKDWRKLPLFKNQGKSRARVLRERKASGGKDCI